MIDLIPAIDLINGKCVRLSQGDYSRSKEYGDPLDMAMQFEDHGLSRLHLVDLDGAREKRVVNYPVLEKIAGKTSLRIDVGGGLRSVEDVRIVFESGASMATGGSIAAKDRDGFLTWIATFGSGRIILGADFRDDRIAVSGWTEDSGLELLPFLRDYLEEGVRQAICTDISLDGMLSGPSLGTYTMLRRELPELHLIASGGIAAFGDVLRLQKEKLHGVIIGKAIYEGAIELKELERFVLSGGTYVPSYLPDEESDPELNQESTAQD